MNNGVKRNHLTPWYIGLVIILAAIGYVGYQMQATNCGISGSLAFIILGIVPAVYLVLMYLTFISQK